MAEKHFEFDFLICLVFFDTVKVFRSTVRTRVPKGQQSYFVFPFVSFVFVTPETDPLLLSSAMVDVERPFKAEPGAALTCWGCTLALP